jgi:hypothetical protein
LPPLNSDQARKSGQEPDHNDGTRDPLSILLLLCA